MSEKFLTEGAVLTALEELSSMQWGLVATGQAKQIGIERLWLSRLMDRGVIHRIRHGAYALPSATHGPLQELQAAWLTTDRTRTLEDRVMSDNNIVVSHISASNVHELGDLVATRHEFSSTTRRQTAQQDIHFYRRELAPEDITLIDGLPVTSVARTIADLAGRHVDFDHLAQAVKDAFNKGTVDFQTLATRLNPSAGAYNYDDGNEFVDALINEAGLPTTTASLIARNLSSALSPQLEQILQEINSPQYIENLQKGLRAALPALKVAQEFSETFSKLLQTQLPNIDSLPWVKQLDLPSWTQSLPSGLQQLPRGDRPQSSRTQNPAQSTPPRESEQQAGDHEANEP